MHTYMWCQTRVNEIMVSLCAYMYVTYRAVAKIIIILSLYRCDYCYALVVQYCSCKVTVVSLHVTLMR